jgi:dipeptidyl aminopeptidase/acylaminoacyl peptidase
MTRASRHKLLVPALFLSLFLSPLTAEKEKGLTAEECGRFAITRQGEVVFLTEGDVTVREVEDLDPYRAPRWLPDGRSVAVWNRQGERIDVSPYEAPSREALEESMGTQNAFSFVSPDGELRIYVDRGKLVFHDGKTGRSAVHKQAPMPETEPEFSSSSRYVKYAAGGRAYMYGREENEHSLLPEWIAPDAPIRWAPHKDLFLVHDRGKLGLLVMAPDGRFKKITDKFFSHFSWASESGAVVYVTPSPKKLYGSDVYLYGLADGATSRAGGLKTKNVTFLGTTPRGSHLVYLLRPGLLHKVVDLDAPPVLRAFDLAAGESVAAADVPRGTAFLSWWSGREDAAVPLFTAQGD